MEAWRRLGMWLVAGSVTGVSLLVPYGFLLMLFGLSLQVYLLTTSTRTRHVAVGALLAATSHMLIVLLWGFSMESLASLGLSLATQGIFVAFVWFSSALVIGVGVALAMALVSYLAAGNQKWLLGLFPFTLLGGEILGRIFFSLYTLGPSGGLAPAFGFGQVGYALGTHGVLIYAAQFGGVYALTFLFGVLSVSVYLLRFRPRWLQAAVIIFVLTAFLRVPMELPEALTNIGLVETNVPLSERLLVLARDASIYEAIVFAAISQNMDTIILPEDSRFLDSHDDNETISSSLTIIDTAGKRTNGVAIQGAQIFNQGVIESGDEKQYLVPFGEYMPLLHSNIFSWLGYAELVETMQSSFGYEGHAPAAPVRYSASLPPVLFCYESAVPYALSARIGGQPVPYVAHVVSHAWFADSSGMLKTQLRAMLRIQAVENKVFILQSANQAPAAVFAPNGAIFQAEDSQARWKIFRVADIVIEGTPLIY